MELVTGTVMTDIFAALNQDNMLQVLVSLVTIATFIMSLATHLRLRRIRKFIVRDRREQRSLVNIPEMCIHIQNAISASADGSSEQSGSSSRGFQDEHLIRCHERLKQYLSLAFDVNLDAGNPLLVFARSHERARDYEDAITNYGLALRMDPDVIKLTQEERADCLQGLQRCFLLVGEIDEARKVVRRARSAVVEGELSEDYLSDLWDERRIGTWRVLLSCYTRFVFFLKDITFRSRRREERRVRANFR